MSKEQELVEVTIGDSGDYEIEVIIDNGKRKYAKYFDNDYEAQQWIDAQPFKVTCIWFSKSRRAR